MIDNLQTAKVLGYMRPLRSVNLVLQESFSLRFSSLPIRNSARPSCSIHTIRWAHCLNFQHCPKHRRLLPSTGRSKRTLLHGQDWGLLDGFFKCRYESSYQVPFPLLLLVQWERRPEIFYLNCRSVLFVERISPTFLKTERWCLSHWVS